MAAPRERGFRARFVGWEFPPGMEGDFALGFLRGPPIRGVVVGDEGVELEGEVVEAGAVGPLQHLLRHGEALPVAGRRRAVAPMAGGVEAGDAVDDGGERGALVLLDETPVTDVLEPSVRLFAEVERDLISERTREGLARGAQASSLPIVAIPVERLRARASGRTLSGAADHRQEPVTALALAPDGRRLEPRVDAGARDPDRQPRHRGREEHFGHHRAARRGASRCTHQPKPARRAGRRETPRTRSPGWWQASVRASLIASGPSPGAVRVTERRARADRAHRRRAADRRVPGRRRGFHRRRVRVLSRVWSGRRSARPGCGSRTSEIAHGIEPHPTEFGRG